jgi:hypothetical protein
MTTPDFRAALERWRDLAQTDLLCPANPAETDWGAVVVAITATRAALAEPEGEGPSDEKLLKTYCEARRAFYFEAAEGESEQEDRKAATIAGLRATLARWGNSAQPAPLADLAAKLISESKPMDPEMAEALTPEARWDLYSGPAAPPALEPGELIAWLHDHALNCRELGRNDWAAQVTSAADLLQQLSAPTPPPAPAGGLVDRVAEKMGPQSQAAMDAGELPYGAARAAIREVAAWMRENEVGYNAVRWLEQEVNRA